MPISKLRLDSLPADFTLISQPHISQRRALVRYPRIVPPHSLINALMKATDARTVSLKTPFNRDGSMTFELLAAHGRGHHLGFE